MAVVRLVHGDLFAGPADMITLPCSTGGTVTHMVERRLQQFSLPHPGKMALGQVEVLPLDDADQVAQYVAFAASVVRYTSEPQAISRIAEQLGRVSSELDAVESISVPLLGAGAGRLSPQVVLQSLQNGFEQTASANAVLSIFILRAGDYAELAQSFGRESGPAAERGSLESFESGIYRSGRRHRATSLAPTPPRVLISHSALSPERHEWLIDLYKYLRENGINARLDAYALRPGMDLVQWMCNELEQADRVLLICDERYSDRADGRHGGVGWETMLIQGDLYAAMYGDQSHTPHTGSKYIPIVLTSDLDQGRPKYLKTLLAVHWPEGADEEKRRKDLVRELFGDSKILEGPPIGPRPTWL
jgi:hypothetical protein